MIKNVIFDIGNVLVSFDWYVLAREIGFTDEDLEILMQKVIGDRWNEFDRGVMPEEEALKYVQEVIPGLEEKFATLWNRIDEAIEVYPYVDEWMRRLKDDGYHIYLLSNFPRNLFKKEAEEKFDFIRYVDGKIISSFVRMIKPDLEIYECLLDTFGLNAGECVFLDDRKKNTEAASKLGIHTIVFQNFEQADGELRKLLAEER
ncbi:MAG: HAD family phosphatase [Lachnospiraceae bacterium]|nr:HAD family phosphatase [Lachnospiraceae bacterium]